MREQKNYIYSIIVVSQLTSIVNDSCVDIEYNNYIPSLQCKKILC